MKTQMYYIAESINGYEVSALVLSYFIGIALLIHALNKFSK